tara:strand:+ start:510 stop:881 length:372 start_codon:yes stop_codon:yes gene_type:complete
MSLDPGIDNIPGGLVPSLFFGYTFMQWGNSLLQGCPSSEGLFFCATPGQRIEQGASSHSLGSQGRKATKAASKAARPKLASSQAFAYIKRSRAQAFATRKGASPKKKTNKGASFPYIYKGGKG